MNPRGRPWRRPGRRGYVGCCVVSYDRPHDFTPDERAVLTSLAGLIAQALDRARLYDAEHGPGNRWTGGDP
ncbi:GAF domain-containing protein [Streptomyces rugosispiralis]|uniref:GAF domain-containing protein n=1 Tax=Streptomyces rugosispiralis TaxID=2967341 RepID=A0ABT1UTW8_9ACTN|nr:GAF domain-containing protein [Streptomyces rugosispiralis]MCQ8187786.1 GAF domain-containing protein [Streptomyces rugosispiralis]